MSPALWSDVDMCIMHAARVLGAAANARGDVRDNRLGGATAAGGAVAARAAGRHANGDGGPPRWPQSHQLLGR